MFGFWLMLAAILPLQLPAQPAAAMAAGQPASDNRQSTADGITGLPAFVLRTYQFLEVDGRVRLEIRFGLMNDLLQFVHEQPDRYLAGYEATLALLNEAGDFVTGRTWKRQLQVHTFAETNDRQHLNEEQAVFLVAAGKYELRLEITDRETRKRLQRRYPLQLRGRQPQRLQLSSLVLGCRQPGSDSLRYNFAALLTSQDDHQGIHFEITGATPGDTLLLTYEIADWRKTVLAHWQRRQAAATNRLAIFEPFGRRLQHQGPHRLRVTVQCGRDTARAEVDFRVNLPSFEDPPAGQAAPDFLQMPLAVLRYVSTAGEYKRLMAAHARERDSLLAAFWRRRDPTPGTEQNELRDEFYRRVKFAEARFALTGVNKAGWETDRGRIYILYGPPQEVHHRLEEAGSSPYEVWLYPQRDRYFIFRDKQGSGDFKLVNR
ncbi:MAG: GWxTD domain-containing protein [candidate division KSB1 bacterium]|nr:GWxTD domain-containing protein [candidate division KSB1 bacterium]MDZ7273919.1 GWxTD domain-containing protein [candidate division KSB1 bacterium]MDZ7286075.1 GWxTD domain-containing protein [candidate division KSB1 bacterium]MDZ7299107.1 GWxTD domain-containing protein [candidate division KSB1 bacterium]MDZ7349748.1 GWxTD domain-containing protein [candidate division KSB1 bacterium]